MKELVVMASLMTLGYAAQTSFVFLLGESCRFVEEMDANSPRVRVVTVTTPPSEVVAMGVQNHH